MSHRFFFSFKHYGQRNGCFRCATDDTPCYGCATREAEELEAAQRPRARPKKRTITDVIDETIRATRKSFFLALDDMNLETVAEMLQKKGQVSSRSKREEYLLQDLNTHVPVDGMIGFGSPSKRMYIMVYWNASNPQSVRMLKLFFDALVVRGQTWNHADELWLSCNQTKRRDYIPFADLLCAYGYTPMIGDVKDEDSDDEDSDDDDDDADDDDDEDYEYELPMTVGRVVRGHIDTWNRRKHLLFLSEM